MGIRLAMDVFHFQLVIDIGLELSTFGRLVLVIFVFSYFVFADPYGTAHFFPGYHQYGNPADSFADVRARHSSPNINQQNLTSEYDGSVTSYSKR